MRRTGADAQVTFVVMAAMAAMLLTLAPVRGEEKAAEGKKEALKLTEKVEVVVTATRSEVTLESAPGSVELVTQKDLEIRNVQTMDEALANISGVAVSHSETPRSGSVTMRGTSSSSRTLILVDGSPMNDSYSSSTAFDQIATQTVERVEVVKGGASSLYGGNAIGGVINIITRMPEKRELTIRSSYGNTLSGDDNAAPNDYKKASVSYGDKLGNFRFILSYDVGTSNNYANQGVVTGVRPPEGVAGWSSTTDATGTIEQYLVGDRGDSPWRRDNILAKGQYAFSPTTRFTFSYARAKMDYGYENPHTYLEDRNGNDVWSYGSSVNANTFLNSTGDLLYVYNVYNYGFETQVSKASIRLTGGFMDQPNPWYTSKSASSTTSGGPGTIVEYPSSSLNTDLQVSLPLGARHTVTTGVSWRRGAMHREYHNLSNWKDETSKTDLVSTHNGKDRSYAFFVQDQIVLANKLIAYVGFREDWWKTYDGDFTQYGRYGSVNRYGDHGRASFSPKGAVVYSPFLKTTLRVSGGKAFRSPTLWDLYGTGLTSATNLSISNPDLKPETALSWDGGIEQRLSKGLKVGATYFENHFSDLIYSESSRSSSGVSISTKGNAGKAKNRGLELDAEQRFSSGLGLWSSFTYTTTEITRNSASPESVGKRFTYAPRVMLNVGGDYARGPYGISVTGQYMSKRYASALNTDTANGIYGSYDPYFKTDLKLRYKIRKGVTASFTVNNLFDKEYCNYYRSAGRWWIVEMAYSLFDAE